MRIHTLQGLYLYVENLLQAIISLVKTRNSCKLSLTRVILFFVPKHHMSILCLSLFTGNLPPSRVSSSLTSYSCLLLPCSLTCRKGGYIRHWRKENAVRHTSPTTTNGTSPLLFRTYRADMKSATDISRAASHREKYHISDNRESREKHVTF